MCYDPMSMRSPSRVPILATALIPAFPLQSFFAGRVKSPASDEPAHIAAGLSYLSGRVFHLNLEDHGYRLERALSVAVAGHAYYIDDFAPAAAGRP